MAKLSPIKLRHERLRKKISGTPQRPRLCVHFSGQHIYAQIIDDDAGRTLASVNTTEKNFVDGVVVKPNIATAIKVGKLVADRAIGQSIKKVVFDRGGFLYTGKVKALADAAREGGLEF